MTGIPLAVWFTSPSTTTSHATCTPRSPLNGTSWVSISHNTWKYITKWYHFFMKLFNSKLKQFFLNLLFSSSPQHMKKCHRPQTQACFGSPAEKKFTVNKTSDHLCQSTWKVPSGYSIFMEVKSFLQCRHNSVSMWMFVFRCSMRATTWLYILYVFSQSSLTRKKPIDCTSIGINVHEYIFSNSELH